MDSKWLTRIIQATAIAIALAAVCQELEKPKEERKWHGKVAGFIPYDFRLPTLEKFKEAYWNPYESQIFTPEVFGVGWAINFYTLLEKLRLTVQGDVSEESFLMPTKSIKDILAHIERIEV
ncbi:hypothetical protein ACFLUK_02320 [Chloroflexota bacterium]